MVERKHSIFPDQSSPITKAKLKGRGTSACQEIDPGKKIKNFSLMKKKNLYYILWENVCILEWKNLDLKASGIRSQIYRDTKAPPWVWIAG